MFFCLYSIAQEIEVHGDWIICPTPSTYQVIENDWQPGLSCYKAHNHEYSQFHFGFKKRSYSE